MSGRKTTKFDYIVTAAVICGAVWFFQSSASSRHNEEMSTASNLGLDASQTEIFSSCLTSTHRKKLSSGGGNEQFCGCFAKTVSKEAEQNQFTGVSLALSYVVLRGPYNVLPTERFTNTEARMASDAVVKCGASVGDDARTTFKSTEALKDWCAAKPERASDQRCTILRQSSR